MSPKQIQWKRGCHECLHYCQIKHSMRLDRQHETHEYLWFLFLFAESAAYQRQQIAAWNDQIHQKEEPSVQPDTEVQYHEDICTSWLPICTLFVVGKATSAELFSLNPKHSRTTIVSTPNEPPTSEPIAGDCRCRVEVPWAARYNNQASSGSLHAQEHVLHHDWVNVVSHAIYEYWNSSFWPMHLPVESLLDRCQAKHQGYEHTKMALLRNLTPQLLRLGNAGPVFFNQTKSVPSYSG